MGTNSFRGAILLPRKVGVQLVHSSTTSNFNMAKAQVEAFYETVSGTICYVVYDEATKAAAIIDSVLDYFPNSGSTGTQFSDKVLAFVREKALNVEWVLETHVHADHITASPYLKAQLGGKPRTAIGKRIPIVQKTFANIYNNHDWRTDGSQWDHLLDDDEIIKIGNIAMKVFWTPGHTPDHLSYLIEGDCVFTGDSLFMPDSGTARCDFPNGSAEQLWDSIQRILALDPHTRVFVGHDYAPDGRKPMYEATVEQEKQGNIHVKEGTTKDEFVGFRVKRDGTLDHPRFIIPAIQVNAIAGYFPRPESNGAVYLKYPVNILKAGAGVVPIEQ